MFIHNLNILISILHRIDYCLFMCVLPLTYLSFIPYQHVTTTERVLGNGFNGSTKLIENYFTVYFSNAKQISVIENVEAHAPL